MVAMPEPGDPSERRAIDRCRSGDIEGLRVLYERHSESVFRICLRILGDAARAEDEAHEVFLSAFRALPRFDGRSRLSTWLYRIAVNRCLNGLRDGARVVAHPPGASEPEAAGADSPEQRLAQREAADAVQDLLDALPESHRAILVLREIEELEYAEIAQVLGVPVGTVMSRLHRARRHARQLWESAAATGREERRG